MSLGLVKTPQPPSVLSMGVRMCVRCQWGLCPVAVFAARFRTAWHLVSTTDTMLARYLGGAPVLGSPVIVAVGLWQSLGQVPRTKAGP